MAMLSLVGSTHGELLDRLRMFDATAKLVLWADAATPRLVGALRRETPSPKSTGRLRDSVRAHRHTSIGEVRLEFTSDVPYAPFVIHGTSAHDIWPTNVLALHWETEGGGNVFAMHVSHPGTRPNNYPQRALDREAPWLIATFYALFERI